MLDKKHIGAIFLFECKMVVKQQTVHNISNSFDPGTDDKHTVQWRLKFCKGNESLEDEESTSAIFLQGKCFHNKQEAENAFQEFVKS